MLGPCSQRVRHVFSLPPCAALTPSSQPDAHGKHLCWHIGLVARMRGPGCVRPSCVDHSPSPGSSPWSAAAGQGPSTARASSRRRRRTARRHRPRPTTRRDRTTRRGRIPPLPHPVGQADAAAEGPHGARRERRQGARTPGQAAADRVALRGAERTLRPGDDQGGRGFPGQARPAAHGEHGHGDLGAAGEDDTHTDARRAVRIRRAAAWRSRTRAA